LLRLSDGRGLVTIYKDTRSAYLQLFRSVFERRAPRSLAAVEAAIGEPLRQGNVIYEVSDQLLAALTAAYEEAGTGQLPTCPAGWPSRVAGVPPWLMRLPRAGPTWTSIRVEHITSP